MSLVCPNCNFRRSAEAGIRLEVCPKCAADGNDVYLVAPKKPRRRRQFDLIGLMTTARDELARGKSAPSSAVDGSEGGQLSP